MRCAEATTAHTIIDTSRRIRFIQKRGSLKLAGHHRRRLEYKVRTFFSFYHFLTIFDVPKKQEQMADDYIGKKMEEYIARKAASPVKQKRGTSLSSLLLENRSHRAFARSFVVREDQLRRIVSVNSRVASARNRQTLRFRLVMGDEAKSMLPLIKMGSAFKDVQLSQVGYEPNAFIVVCSTIEPRQSTYVDLGISVQSMLLQAVEIGLNGVCIMSLDKQQVTELLALPFEPLVVLAIGRSAERVKIVDIKDGDNCDYYREDGVHCVPKIVPDDLIIK
jgi:nitroreductase